MPEVKSSQHQPIPYLIAELSANHNGSLERALKLVDAAAEAGAHAVKMQTYTADTMTLDLDSDDFINTDIQSPWFGRKLHSLYKEAHTPWEWHKPIADRALERGLSWLSSPFDETAVDFLESLSVPMYKIASFECVDLPLIKYVARTGKPMIISTGMASVNEIWESVEAARSEKNSAITLLHCTSSYPARPEDANLQTMSDMRERFSCPVGLSDHTLGSVIAIAASTLGATVIEKHLTLSRSDGGPDSTFSMEPQEFKQMASAIDLAMAGMGSIFYGPTESEKGSVLRRRSLYVGQNMKKGDKFNSINLRRIRPGYGLAPKYYFEILGRQANKDIIAGTPVTWDLISETS